MQRVVGGCYNEFVILYKDQKIAFVYMYMLLDMCARGLVCTIQKYLQVKVYPSSAISVIVDPPQINY